MSWKQLKSDCLKTTVPFPLQLVQLSSAQKNTSKVPHWPHQVFLSDCIIPWLHGDVDAMWHGVSVEFLTTYFVPLKAKPSSLGAETEAQLRKRRKSDNYYWSLLASNWQLFLEVSAGDIVHKMLGNLPVHWIDISARLFSSYLYLAIFQDLFDCLTKAPPVSTLCLVTQMESSSWLLHNLGHFLSCPVGFFMLFSEMVAALLMSGRGGYRVTNQVTAKGLSKRTLNPHNLKLQNFAEDFTLQSRKYIFLPFFEKECNLAGILLGE